MNGKGEFVMQPQVHTCSVRALKVTYSEGMTSITTIACETGEIVRTWGSYDSASQARSALARELGQPLKWVRADTAWEAVCGELVYRIQADPALVSQTSD